MGCLLSGAQAEAVSGCKASTFTWDRGGGILEEVVGWRLLMTSWISRFSEQGLLRGANT